MRSTTFISSLAVCTAILGASWLWLENRQLRQQLELSQDQASQLQTLAESNTQQRQQIDLLNRQLRSSAYQLSSLSNTLQQARLAADSDSGPAANDGQGAGAGGSAAFAAFSDPGTAIAMANANLPRMYDSFINTLGIPGTERQQVMDAILEFAAQRYRSLQDLIAGTLAPQRAQALFGADALAAHLGDELSRQQQDDLRQYQQRLMQDTLHQVYQQAMPRSGVAIQGRLQARVLQALLDEVVSAQNNWGALVAADGSMLSAHRDRVAAFERARMRLAADLNSEQLAQLDRFIAAQSDGVDVILEASTDNQGRIGITQARIGVEELPQ